MQLPMVKVEVSFAVTDAMVDQILVTAFDGNYGGSLYWADVENIEMLKDESKAWIKATIIEQEGGQRHFIDGERIAYGLKKYIEDDMISESHLAETINSEATDFDANDADIIVQLAVFGKVTYA